MALENYLLAEIVREASPLVINQPIGRIFEPRALDFALLLRRGDNLCLFASLLPARPTLYLTNRSFKSLEGDRTPGHFTNLMRKYLTGATISNFTKEPDERRIRIELTSFDASGNPLILNLIIELMGRSANAHLFVENAYLASLRELPENSINSINSINLIHSNNLNNSTLSSTKPKNNIDPKLLDHATFTAMVCDSSLTEVARNLTGFSPTLVRELIARAEQSEPFDALQSLLKDIDQQPGQARIYFPAPQSLPASGNLSTPSKMTALVNNRMDNYLDQLPIGTLDARSNLLLSYFDLEIAASLSKQRFDTLNHATESYFNLLTCIDAFQSRRSGIVAKLKAELTKLELLQKKLRAEAAEFAQADDYRRFGDLILANLGTLTRKNDELLLIDYFDPEQREFTIKIAENQTPQQLAEEYFKRYQRARRGAQLISQRILDVEKDLLHRQKRFEAIKAAIDEAALDRAEGPLAPTKLSSDKQLSGKLKAGGKIGGKTGGKPGVSLRHYLSSDGYEILVGRSDASNDQLTFRIAKSTDIWLHAADYPGPHVLIRNPDRHVVPPRTIFEAAQLAAFFSKARGETSAVVRYAEKKHVTRPKKAKPGLALLTQFKTMAVPPLEAGQRML